MSVLPELSVAAFPWGRKPPTVDDVVKLAMQAERLGFYSVNVPMVNAPLRHDHFFSVGEGRKRPWRSSPDSGQRTA